MWSTGKGLIFFNQKQYNMKKLLIMAVIIGSFTACNENKTDTTTTTSDTLGTTTTGTTTTTTGTGDTSTTMSNNYSTSNAYTPAEGDVSYRNGKVMVWRNGSYIQ